MNNNFVPHLCGGTFFVLLTEAKGIKATRRQLRNGTRDKVSNRNMLEALIQIFVPSFQQPPSGRTFDGDTTDYRACKVSFGENLPFDDEVEIKNFDQQIRNDYITVLNKMDTFVDEFLRTNSAERMQWLIQALLTLLDKDEDIRPETLFFMSKNPITKATLLSENHYCLSALMLALWHFIIMHRAENTEGRRTFEAWHERADEMNAKWRFTSKIGLTYPKPIEWELFSTQTKAEPVIEEVYEEKTEADETEPTVEIYEAPYTDPRTQQQVVAQFHVEAKDNGIAIGQVNGGLVIGKRGKDE